MLFVVMFFIILRFVSRLRQEHGHGQYLKFEHTQNQRYHIRGHRYDDGLESRDRDRRERHDSLTDTVDFIAAHNVHNRHKRAVTPEIWSQYVCKGDKLIALMAMSIEEATKALGFPSESVFKDHSDLDNNGWQMYDKSANFDFKNLNIGPVFQELGFDGASGGPLNLKVKNRVVTWLQDGKYKVDGVEYDVCCPQSFHAQSLRQFTSAKQ